MSWIEVSNLKYRYPHAEKLSLDGISFQVEKGQFIGIIGENGAGKSTLCQAFLGLVPNTFRGAYGGKVVIGDREAAKTPVSDLCRQVGMVFQNPFNQLSGVKDTVFEEVAFGLQNFGVPRDELVRRVEETLELLDIGRYRDQNPFDLSGGQIQRVAIAGILVMHPDVIVLDEPTSQLDPAGSEEVFRVVERLAGTGVTILMAEHKMEKLAAYCQKILLLHEGRQIAYDTPEKIFSREDLDVCGVRPPVYTEVCKALRLTSPDGAYPVTLARTVELSRREELSQAVELPRREELSQAGELSRREELSQAVELPPEKARPLSSSLERGREQAALAEQRIFEIRDLSFRYGEGSPVLDGLDLILDGRPTAIVGQNGAGKTTLVKLLKGLLKPTSGCILYEEEDIAGKTVAQLAGSVGYVFQNPDDQIFKSRVLDEVMVGPLHLGMKREDARLRAEKALEEVGLLKAMDENPYDLELADRKMVALASVLAMETPVLILDEPTIAQDARGRAVIGGLVKKLHAEGRFVLAILHDMDFAAEYFERVIAMAHGTILADGPKEKVFYQKEALRGARLEQPHVTELCEKLGYEGIFMTAADLVPGMVRSGCT